LQIPNSLLSQHLVANYSVSGPVADEILISLSYEEAPGKIEEAILRLLDDITEVLKKPQPTVDPLEFTDTAIRYRIRYWLSRYVLQERVRAQISRSLWYALHRSNIEILTARQSSRRTSHQSAPQNWDGASRSGAEDGLGSRESIAAELRRFYLLRGLSDDELKMLTATTRVLQFGRGEVLIREGEIGESFFILTKGSVEVLERGSGEPRVVRKIEHSSAENFFGEIALLTGQPRSTTIRASTDVEVLEVTREGFVQLFKARPEAAPAIAEIAEARVAESRQRAAMVSSQMTTASSSGFLSSMRRVFDL
jgi:CRP-like cAMP-binding protein